MLIVAVMVVAIAGLIAAPWLVERHSDALEGWLDRGAERVARWARNLIDRFDRFVRRFGSRQPFTTIGAIANRMFAGRRNAAWVGGWAPRPWLAGILLVGLVLMMTLGQMNHVLAGMRPETEVQPTSMTALTGRPWARPSPDRMAEHVQAWARWECADLGRTECDVAEARWTDESARPHESPRSVAQWYLIFDFAFILTYLIVLGWALTAQWMRSAPSGGPDLYRRQLWQRALSVLGGVLVVAAAADVVENIALLAVVDRLGRGPTPATIAGVAMTVKFVGLAIVVAGLLYVVLFRPRQGGPLARRLWLYVRGLSSVRVGGLVAVFTWLLLFGPMFADQMLDVVRRWDPVHAVVVLVLTIVIAAFVGQSSRRVYLRRELRLQRWMPDPRPDDDLCIADNSEASQEVAAGVHKQRGAVLRAVVVTLFLLLGAIALVLAFLGRDELQGLVVPALLIVVLGLAGWPLLPVPSAANEPDDREPLVSPLTPRLLGAAIPAIVGLGVLRAVLPDFVLNADRSPFWVVALAAGIVVGIAMWRLVDVLRRRVADPEVARALRRRVLVGGVLTTLAVTVIVVLRQPPAARDALDPVVMLVVAMVLVALAHTAFYFFADPPIVECLEQDRDQQPAPGDTDTRVGHAHVRPGPAAVLPGPRAVRGRRSEVLLWTPAATLAGIVVWIIVSPIRVPRVLGGLALALLFVLTFALVAEIASRFAEYTQAPLVLQQVGVRRTPMFTFLALWALIMSSSLVPVTGFHDVQVTQGRDPAAADPPTVGQVFDRWLERQDDPALAPRAELGAGTAPVTRRRAVPMVFVSAWGGGIRAGVWTAYVLDCAFEPHDRGVPWKRTSRATVGSDQPCRVEDDSAAESIAAMSGISGGSLGFAQYAMHLVDDPQPSHRWVQRRMGDDYLAPALGRLLFVDMPLSLLGAPATVDDRADVLQRAWEASWHDTPDRIRDGVFELWESEPDLPLMVLNSTSMNHRCSINVSPLNAATQTTVAEDCRSLAPFDPSRRSGRDARAMAPLEEGTPSPTAETGSLVGTHDLERLLCDDQDVPLMSAALMSARFPLVSPTGRIQQCPDPDAPAQLDVFTSDGGQLDPSAALTASQLWEAFEPFVVEYNRRSTDACIAPVLIHMENGFDADLATTTSAPPNEWIDPLLWSLTDAKSGLVGNARQRMALEFSEPLAGPNSPMRLVDTSDTLSPAATRDMALSRSVSRIAYVRTRAHPGSSAPLGWTLSQATQEDLAEQLGRNGTEFARIQKWLSGDIACAPTPSPASETSER